MSSPETLSGWHEGELAVQRRCGVVDHERLRRGVRSSLPPHFIDFVATQGFVIVAGKDGRGMPWCFAAIGTPGMMTVLDSTTIVARRDAFLGHAPGEVLAAGGSIGLLVFDPSSRRRVRINGTVAIDGRSIRITVQEAFGNCQQYVQKRPPEYRPICAGTRPVSLPLSDDLQDRIRRVDTCFLATVHDRDGLDASHRGGRPGFVEVLNGGSACRFADYPGNNMFQTLGNIAANPSAAMLLPDFSTGAMLLLSGRAEIEWIRDGDHESRFVLFHPMAAFDQHPEHAWSWPTIEPSPLNP